MLSTNLLKERIRERFRLFYEALKPYLKLAFFNKMVAVSTTACFFINILYISGYSAETTEELKKRIKQQLAQQQAVANSMSYLSPQEMLKDGGLIFVEDKAENKIYHVSKQSKEIVGFEDLKSGLITRFIKDAAGKTTIKVFTKEGQEVSSQADLKGQAQNRIAEAITGVLNAIAGLFKKSPEEEVTQAQTPAQAQPQQQTAVAPRTEAAKAAQGQVSNAPGYVSQVVDQRFTVAYQAQGPPPPVVETVAQEIESAKEPQEAGIGIEGQTIAEQVIAVVGGWLNKFINAKPEDQIQLALSLGINPSQAVNLTQVTVSNIISYLTTQGAQVINCAVLSLVGLFASQEVDYDVVDLASRALLTDIVAGNLDYAKSKLDATGTPFQLSMMAIQNTAAYGGIKLTGYSTDLQGLSESIKENKAAIAHFTGEDGVGHFVLVTGMDADSVTYVDSDRQAYTVSRAEFASIWSGRVLSQNRIETAQAQVLEQAQLAEAKGAFLGLGRLWNGIKKIGRIIVKPFTFVFNRVLRPVARFTFNKIIKPLVIKPIVAVAKFTFNKVIKPVAKFTYNKIIRPVAKLTYEKFIKPIAKFTYDKLVKPVAKFAYEKVIKPTIVDPTVIAAKGIAKGASAIWHSTVAKLVIIAIAIVVATVFQQHWLTPILVKAAIATAVGTAVNIAAQYAMTGTVDWGSVLRGTIDNFIVNAATIGVGSVIGGTAAAGEAAIEAQQAVTTAQQIAMTTVKVINTVKMISTIASIASLAYTLFTGNELPGWLSDTISWTNKVSCGLSMGAQLGASQFYAKNPEAVQAIANNRAGLEYDNLVQSGEMGPDFATSDFTRADYIAANASRFVPQVVDEVSRGLPGYFLEQTLKNAGRAAIVGGGTALLHAGAQYLITGRVDWKRAGMAGAGSFSTTLDTRQQGLMGGGSNPFAFVTSPWFTVAYRGMQVAAAGYSLITGDELPEWMQMVMNGVGMIHSVNSLYNSSGAMFDGGFGNTINSIFSSVFSASSYYSSAMGDRADSIQRLFGNFQGIFDGFNNLRSGLNNIANLYIGGARIVGGVTDAYQTIILEQITQDLIARGLIEGDDLSRGYGSLNQEQRSYVLQEAFKNSMFRACYAVSAVTSMIMTIANVAANTSKQFELGKYISLGALFSAAIDFYAAVANDLNVYNLGWVKKLKATLNFVSAVANFAAEIQYAQQYYQTRRQMFENNPGLRSALRAMLGRDARPSDIPQVFVERYIEQQARMAQAISAGTYTAEVGPLDITYSGFETGNVSITTFFRLLGMEDLQKVLRAGGDVLGAFFNAAQLDLSFRDCSVTIAAEGIDIPINGRMTEHGFLQIDDASIQAISSVRINTNVKFNNLTFKANAGYYGVLARETGKTDENGKAILSHQIILLGAYFGERGGYRVEGTAVPKMYEQSNLIQSVSMQYTSITDQTGRRYSIQIAKDLGNGTANFIIREILTGEGTISLDLSGLNSGTLEGQISSVVLNTGYFSSTLVIGWLIGAAIQDNRTLYIEGFSQLLTQEEAWQLVQAQNRQGSETIGEGGPKEAALARPELTNLAIGMDENNNLFMMGENGGGGTAFIFLTEEQFNTRQVDGNLTVNSFGAHTYISMSSDVSMQLTTPYGESFTTRIVFEAGSTIFIGQNYKTLFDCRNTIKGGSYSLVTRVKATRTEFASAGRFGLFALPRAGFLEITQKYDGKNFTLESATFNNVALGNNNQLFRIQLGDRIDLTAVFFNNGQKLDFWGVVNTDSITRVEFETQVINGNKIPVMILNINNLKTISRIHNVDGEKITQSIRIDGKVVLGGGVNPGIIYTAMGYDDGSGGQIMKHELVYDGSGGYMFADGQGIKWDLRYGNQSLAGTEIRGIRLLSDGKIAFIVSEALAAGDSRTFNGYNEALRASGTSTKPPEAVKQTSSLLINGNTITNNTIVDPGREQEGIAHIFFDISVAELMANRVDEMMLSGFSAGTLVTVQNTFFEAGNLLSGDYAYQALVFDNAGGAFLIVVDGTGIFANLNSLQDGSYKHVLGTRRVTVSGDTYTFENSAYVTVTLVTHNPGGSPDTKVLSFGTCGITADGRLVGGVDGMGADGRLSGVRAISDVNTRIDIYGKAGVQTVVFAYGADGQTIQIVGTFSYDSVKTRTDQNGAVIGYEVGESRTLVDRTDPNRKLTITVGMIITNGKVQRTGNGSIIGSFIGPDGKPKDISATLISIGNGRYRIVGADGNEISSQVSIGGQNFDYVIKTVNFGQDGSIALGIRLTIDAGQTLTSRHREIRTEGGASKDRGAPRHTGGTLDASFNAATGLWSFTNTGSRSVGVLASISLQDAFTGRAEGKAVEVTAFEVGTRINLRGGTGFEVEDPSGIRSIDVSFKVSSSLIIGTEGGIYSNLGYLISGVALVTETARLAKGETGKRITVVTQYTGRGRGLKAEVDHISVTVDGRNLPNAPDKFRLVNGETAVVLRGNNGVVVFCGFFAPNQVVILDRKGNYYDLVNSRELARRSEKGKSIRFMGTERFTIDENNRKRNIGVVQVVMSGHILGRVLSDVVFDPQKALNANDVHFALRAPLMESFTINFGAGGIVDSAMLRGLLLTYVMRNGERVPEIQGLIFGVRENFGNVDHVELSYDPQADTQKTLPPGVFVQTASLVMYEKGGKTYYRFINRPDLANDGEVGVIIGLDHILSGNVNAINDATFWSFSKGMVVSFDETYTYGVQYNRAGERIMVARTINDMRFEIHVTGTLSDNLAHTKGDGAVIDRGFVIGMAGSNFTRYIIMGQVVFKSGAYREIYHSEYDSVTGKRVDYVINLAAFNFDAVQISNAYNIKPELAATLIKNGDLIRNPDGSYTLLRDNIYAVRNGETVKLRTGSFLTMNGAVIQSAGVGGIGLYARALGYGLRDTITYGKMGWSVFKFGASSLVSDAGKWISATGSVTYGWTAGVVSAGYQWADTKLIQPAAGRISAGYNAFMGTSFGQGLASFASGFAETLFLAELTRGIAQTYNLGFSGVKDLVRWAAVEAAASVRDISIYLYDYTVVGRIIEGTGIAALARGLSTIYDLGYSGTKDLLKWGAVELGNAVRDISSYLYNYTVVGKFIEGVGIGALARGLAQVYNLGPIGTLKALGRFAGDVIDGIYNFISAKIPQPIIMAAKAVFLAATFLANPVTATVAFLTANIGRVLLNAVVISAIVKPFVDNAILAFGAVSEMISIIREQGIGAAFGLVRSGFSILVNELIVNSILLPFGNMARNFVIDYVLNNQFVRQFTNFVNTNIFTPLFGMARTVVNTFIYRPLNFFGGLISGLNGWIMSEIVVPLGIEKLYTGAKVMGALVLMSLPIVNTFLTPLIMGFTDTGRLIRDFVLNNAWEIAKVGVGVVGVVVGTVVAIFFGWTGVGAAVGVGLIAGAITFMGVGSLTILQTGSIRQAMKEATVDGLIAAIPFGGIGARVATKASIAIVERTGASLARRSLAAVVERFSVRLATRIIGKQALRETAEVAVRQAAVKATAWQILGRKVLTNSAAILKDVAIGGTVYALGATGAGMISGQRPWKEQGISVYTYFVNQFLEGAKWALYLSGGIRILGGIVGSTAYALGGARGWVRFYRVVNSPFGLTRYANRGVFGSGFMTGARTIGARILNSAYTPVRYILSVFDRAYRAAHLGGQMLTWKGIGHFVMSAPFFSMADVMIQTAISSYKLTKANGYLTFELNWTSKAQGLQLWQKFLLEPFQLAQISVIILTSMQVFQITGSALRSLIGLPRGSVSAFINVLSARHSVLGLSRAIRAFFNPGKAATLIARNLGQEQAAKGLFARALLSIDSSLFVAGMLSVGQTIGEIIAGDAVVFLRDNFGVEMTEEQFVEKFTFAFLFLLPQAHKPFGFRLTDNLTKAEIRDIFTGKDQSIIEKLARSDPDLPIEFLRLDLATLKQKILSESGINVTKAEVEMITLRDFEIVRDAEGNSVIRGEGVITPNPESPYTQVMRIRDASGREVEMMVSFENEVGFRISGDAQGNARMSIVSGDGFITAGRLNINGRIFNPDYARFEFRQNARGETELYVIGSGKEITRVEIDATGREIVTESRETYRFGDTEAVKIAELRDGKWESVAADVVQGRSASSIIEGYTNLIRRALERRLGQGAQDAHIVEAAINGIIRDYGSLEAWAKQLYSGGKPNPVLDHYLTQAARDYMIERYKNRPDVREATANVVMRTGENLGGPEGRVNQIVREILSRPENKRLSELEKKFIRQAVAERIMESLMGRVESRILELLPVAGSELLRLRSLPRSAEVWENLLKQLTPEARKLFMDTVSEVFGIERGLFDLRVGPEFGVTVDGVFGEAFVLRLFSMEYNLRIPQLDTIRIHLNSLETTNGRITGQKLNFERLSLFNPTAGGKTLANWLIIEFRTSLGLKTDTILPNKALLEQMISGKIGKTTYDRLFGRIFGDGKSGRVRLLDDIVDRYNNPATRDSAREELISALRDTEGLLFTERSLFLAQQILGDKVLSGLLKARQQDTLFLMDEAHLYFKNVMDLIISGGDKAPLSRDYTDSYERAYDALTKLFGEKDGRLNVDLSDITHFRLIDGRVFLTDATINMLRMKGLEINIGVAESILTGVRAFREQSVFRTGDRIVPLSELTGRAEYSRQFQDVYFILGAARESGISRNALYQSAAQSRTTSTQGLATIINNYRYVLGVTGTPPKYSPILDMLGFVSLDISLTPKAAVEIQYRIAGEGRTTFDTLAELAVERFMELNVDVIRGKNGRVVDIRIRNDAVQIAVQAERVNDMVRMIETRLREVLMKNGVDRSMAERFVREHIYRVTEGEIQTLAAGNKRNMIAVGNRIMGLGVDFGVNMSLFSDSKSYTDSIKQQSKGRPMRNQEFGEFTVVAEQKWINEQWDMLGRLRWTGREGGKNSKLGERMIDAIRRGSEVTSEQKLSLIQEYYDAVAEGKVSVQTISTLVRDLLIEQISSQMSPALRERFMSIYFERSAEMSRGRFEQRGEGFNGEEQMRYELKNTIEALKRALEMMGREGSTEYNALKKALDVLDPLSGAATTNFENIPEIMRTVGLDFAGRISAILSLAMTKAGELVPVETQMRRPEKFMVQTQADYRAKLKEAGYADTAIDLIVARTPGFNPDGILSPQGLVAANQVLRVIGFNSSGKMMDPGAIARQDSILGSIIPGFAMGTVPVHRAYDAIEFVKGASGAGVLPFDSMSDLDSLLAVGSLISAGKIKASEGIPVTYEWLSNVVRIYRQNGLTGLIENSGLSGDMAGSRVVAVNLTAAERRVIGKKQTKLDLEKRLRLAQMGYLGQLPEQIRQAKMRASRDLEAGRKILPVFLGWGTLGLQINLGVRRLYGKLFNSENSLLRDILAGREAGVDSAFSMLSLEQKGEDLFLSETSNRISLIEFIEKLKAQGIPSSRGFRSGKAKLAGLSGLDVSDRDAVVAYVEDLFTGPWTAIKTFLGVTVKEKTILDRLQTIVAGGVEVRNVLLLYSPELAGAIVADETRDVDVVLAELEAQVSETEAADGAALDTQVKQLAAIASIRGTLSARAVDKLRKAAANTRNTAEQRKAAINALAAVAKSKKAEAAARRLAVDALGAVVPQAEKADAVAAEIAKAAKPEEAKDEAAELAKKQWQEILDSLDAGAPVTKKPRMGKHIFNVSLAIGIGIAVLVFGAPVWVAGAALSISMLINMDIKNMMKGAAEARAKGAGIKGILKQQFSQQQKGLGLTGLALPISYLVGLPFTVVSLFITGVTSLKPGITWLTTKTEKQDVNADMKILSAMLAKGYSPRKTGAAELKDLIDGLMANFPDMTNWAGLGLGDIIGMLADGRGFELITKLGKNVDPKLVMAAQRFAQLARERTKAGPSEEEIEATAEQIAKARGVPMETARLMAKAFIEQKAAENAVSSITMGDIAVVAASVFGTKPGTSEPTDEAVRLAVIAFNPGFSPDVAVRNRDSVARMLGAESAAALPVAQIASAGFTSADFVADQVLSNIRSERTEALTAQIKASLEQQAEKAKAEGKEPMSAEQMEQEAAQKADEQFDYTYADILEAAKASGKRPEEILNNRIFRLSDEQKKTMLANAAALGRFIEADQLSLGMLAEEGFAGLIGKADDAARAAVRAGNSRAEIANRASRLAAFAVANCGEDIDVNKLAKLVDEVGALIAKPDGERLSLADAAGVLGLKGIFAPRSSIKAVPMNAKNRAALEALRNELIGLLSNPAARSVAAGLSKNGENAALLYGLLNMGEVKDVIDRLTVLSGTGNNAQVVISLARLSFYGLNAPIVSYLTGKMSYSEFAMITIGLSDGIARENKQRAFATLSKMDKGLFAGVDSGDRDALAEAVGRIIGRYGLVGKASVKSVAAEIAEIIANDGSIKDIAAVFKNANAAADRDALVAQITGLLAPEDPQNLAVGLADAIMYPENGFNLLAEAIRAMGVDKFSAIAGKIITPELAQMIGVERVIQAATDIERVVSEIGAVPSEEDVLEIAPEELELLPEVPAAPAVPAVPVAPVVAQAPRKTMSELTAADDVAWLNRRADEITSDRADAFRNLTVRAAIDRLSDAFGIQASANPSIGISEIKGRVKIGQLGMGTGERLKMMIYNVTGNDLSHEQIQRLTYAELEGLLNNGVDFGAPATLARARQAEEATARVAALEAQLAREQAEAERAAKGAPAVAAEAAAPAPRLERALDIYGNEVELASETRVADGGEVVSYFKVDDKGNRQPVVLVETDEGPRAYTPQQLVSARVNDALTQKIARAIATERDDAVLAQLQAAKMVIDTLRGRQIVNCAVQAVANIVLGTDDLDEITANPLMMTIMMSFVPTMYWVDVINRRVTGDIAVKGVPELSMAALKEGIAKAREAMGYGSDMQGARVSGPQDLLTIFNSNGNRPMILHLSNGSIGHFVVVDDVSSRMTVDGEKIVIRYTMDNRSHTLSYNMIRDDGVRVRGFDDKFKFTDFILADLPEGVKGSQLSMEQMAAAMGGATLMSDVALATIRGGALGVLPKAAAARPATTAGDITAMVRESQTGFMAPKDLNPVIGLVFRICENRSDLYKELGIEPGEYNRASDPEFVISKYKMQVELTNALAGQGLMNESARRIQLALLAVERDILMVNGAIAEFDTLARDYNSGERVNIQALSDILYSGTRTPEYQGKLAEMMRVIKPAAVQAAAEKAPETPVEEVVDLTRAFDEIRAEVERERTMGERFERVLTAIGIGPRTLDDDIKSVYDDFEFRGTIIEKKGSKLVSPLGARAMIGAA
ncbi:MAG: hypothetical protein JW803_00035 [Endomicrobiales bacterium]|nr:hypothetical protein [Endomicrobiales bacterium]